MKHASMTLYKSLAPLERIENTREIEWVIQGGRVYEPRELIGGLR